MKPAAAAAALGALAQERRLAIFRRLVTEGALGLPAGTLASELRLAPPNLSFHLHHLKRAGLVRARRRGRQVFYAVEVHAMRALLNFLVQDCCHGQPELCLPAPAEACCPPVSRPAVKA